MSNTSTEVLCLKLLFTIRKLCLLIYVLECNIYFFSVESNNTCYFMGINHGEGVSQNLTWERQCKLSLPDSVGGTENAGVANAGVENTRAETYEKPSIQKSLMVEARIRMCLIVNGRQSPISGKPNRTDWPGF